MADLAPVDQQPEFDHSLVPVDYNPFAAEQFANPAVKSAIDSTAGLVAAPGKLIAPNPYPPGSEEASWYEDQPQQGYGRLGTASRVSYDGHRR